MPCCFGMGVDCGVLGLVVRRFGVLRESLAKSLLGFTDVRLIAAWVRAFDAPYDIGTPFLRGTVFDMDKFVT